ncbi:MULTISPECIES: hypothetical protein [Stenotrophomonas]|uniref:hypothetical protein n=1 Tax=Stenotrophomonas pavanii TaxID=487698 RepID=UPI0005A4B845
MHYKRAKLLSGAPLDLQTLVAEAIRDSQTVDAREEGDAVRRVLSGIGNTNGMLTAKFMQFTIGQKAHFLEKDSATGDYKLDTTAVPDNDGTARREFVESLTFLAISSSHVMFVAALHLGSKALEEHLNWLLKKFSKIETSDFIILADQQSASAEQRLARHPVDSVTIGAELDFEVVELVKTQRKTKDRETVPGYKSVRPVGPVADMLGSLIGDWFGDVPLTKALGKDERIKATLKLNYSNRRKSEEGFEMMQKLAVAGRHFDADETRVHLHKGGTLRGSDLKVQTSLQVSVLDSGMIDEFDLWGKVHSWLRHAIATSIVPQ